MQIFSKCTKASPRAGWVISYLAFDLLKEGKKASVCRAFLRFFFLNLIACILAKRSQSIYLLGATILVCLFLNTKFFTYESDVVKQTFFSKVNNKIVNNALVYFRPYFRPIHKCIMSKISMLNVFLKRKGFE